MIKDPLSATSSSFMRTASTVMAGLENGEPRRQVVADRLNGDSELFDMMILFLRSNKWIAADNRMTDKGKSRTEGYMLS